jgi:hypothetical protein
MSNDTTRRWLLRIATALETWETMRTESVEVAMTVTTPAGAMRYMASKILDIRERADVEAALPTIATDDFIGAARQVREAADGMR